MKRMLVYAVQLEAVGGIESHVVELCVNLAGAGHHLTLVCSRFALNARDAQRLRAAGIELVVNSRRWCSTRASVKWLWTLLALARLAGERFDVIYTNGQGRIPAAVHAWFRGKVRLVHHHHTSCDAGDIATWPASYIDAMRRADVLVVCANYIRPRMQAALGRPRVEVVYCLSREPPIGLTSSAARAPKTPPLVFGYYGRLIREKGIEWILRLSGEPRLADITWKIWGSEATYTAQDICGRSNVEYLGAFTNNEGLAAVMQTLDCYCLFSTHPEGLPVSLIEIMGAGKPWIATGQGGIPELAQDPESCVLVALKDYDGVVTACLAMCERIRVGKIDSARQRAFYQARFSSQSLLAQWTGLLAS